MVVGQDIPILRENEADPWPAVVDDLAGNL